MCISLQIYVVNSKISLALICKKKNIDWHILHKLTLTSNICFDGIARCSRCSLLCIRVALVVE